MSDIQMPQLGMSVQPPPPWVKQQEVDDDQGYKLTSLDESDDRFLQISIDFRNAGMNVSKVEMLKNGHLCKRYSQEIDLLSEQRKTDSNFKLNERYLYHGTSIKKTYICDEGLDSRMSNEGCFGKGIYFSDFPRKCVKYAEKGKNKESCILLVRVILGVPKVYPKGKKVRTLKREPEKEEPYTGHRFYDSVEGCPVNHKEFVVYDSRRALVEGIISYTRQEKKAKQASTNESDDKNCSGDEDDSVDVLNDSIDSDDGENNNEDDDDTDLDDEDLRDDGGNSSHDSDSEYEDNTTPFRKLTKEEVQRVLTERRDQFKEETGLTDEYEIDRFLLRGNMKVNAAVKIFTDLNGESLPMPELDLEAELANIKKYPLPNTPAWDALSKEDKDAFIQGQIEDFLTITSLDNESTELARRYLTAVNMKLDHAVVAYYEDIEAE